MDLRYYLNIVGRRWWLLLLPPIIAGAAAFLVSESLTDMYEGETTILINQSRVQGLPETYTELLASTRLTATYSKLVVQRPVLTAVINELDLPHTVRELKGKIDVEPVLDTQLIVVKAKDPDPTMAAIITNVLVEKFIEINDADVGRPGAISVTSPAVPPENRSEPNVALNMALAIIIGLLIGVGAVLLWENLGTVPVQDGRNELLEVRERGEVDQSGYTG